MTLRYCQIDVHEKNIRIYFSQSTDVDVWVVEKKKDADVVIDRYKSHLCPEGMIRYSINKELQWIDAVTDDIPKEQTKYAAEQEMRMLEGKYRHHKSCLDSVWQLRVNAKSIMRAKGNIVGVWGDDESEIKIRDCGKLSIRGPSDSDHPLYALSNRGDPDWWDFSRWTLSLGSMEMGGLRYPVYKCADNELHIISSEHKF
jgi:hypothetical protein